MAAYREEEDPFEEDIVFDQAGLLNNTSKINTAIRRVSSGKCVLFAKTLGLCGAFFGLGLCIAIPGPTFLSPLTALEVNVSNIYVARSSGYLIGAVIGGMLFDHFNRLFLLFLSLLLTSVFITVAPWCQILWLQVACMVILGITMGFLDTGGNVLCLDLWGRNSGPFMQALHFSFGLGAFVAPLLAVPFLEPTTLNATFATDVSQVATEFPVHILETSGADVFLLDGMDRMKREVEEFNDTVNFNTSQVIPEITITNNSPFSYPKLNIPAESASNNSSPNSEINASVSVTRGSSGPLSQSTTTSVPNITVTVRHKPPKPSITDGSKLGNKNWEGVHVGRPPPADLLPVTTTGSVKLSTVLVSTVPSPVLRDHSKFSIGTEKQNVETSSQLPDLLSTAGTVTANAAVTSAISSSATFDDSFNLTEDIVTTDEIITSTQFDKVNQGKVGFPDSHSLTFSHESDMLLSSKQKPEWTDSSTSSTHKQKPEWTHSFTSSTQSLPLENEEHASTTPNTVAPEHPFHSDDGDHLISVSEKESVTKVAFDGTTDLPASKNINFQIESLQEPSSPLNFNENSAISSPFSGSVIGSKSNSSYSISGKGLQNFQLSPQDTHVTNGNSLGHEEYYVQNSRREESLDRNNAKAFADSRILSNDNFPKENNESKIESKIDDESVNNSPLADSPPRAGYFISSKLNVTSGQTNSQIFPNNQQYQKVIDGTNSQDFETFPNNELYLPSSSVPSTTALTDGDEISSNYINSVASTKHVHRKPGTFDNDTEHINTIFDVFANRIEKYGFSKLQFSYLIVGIFVFSISVVFLGFLCHNPRDPKSKQEEGQGSKKIVNKNVHKMLVSLMAFFFFLYMGMEVTYGQLVLAFAMHSNLKLSQSTGSVISVVFWGSFAAMRFASIFFASGFSPLTMLILNFVFCTTGTVLVSALANHLETALWVGTALIGIGLASMFPTGILWIERYIHVSNKVAAIFVIGVSLGQMICPITVYRLMINNPQMLMHSALVINMLCILAFVALWWLASRQGEKYSVVINNGYQLANQNDEEEDMLDMSPSGSAVTFRRHSFSSEHRALLNGNVHRGP
ncbi:uncharacterized protein [Anabrus simplex]|uniref:uncharacterized protein n=1 Tax=Anabrus simplex TaxID=316456 RepID=UPI0035A2C819